MNALETSPLQYVSWWWCEVTLVRPSETKKKCSKPLSKFSKFVVACGHFSSHTHTLSRLRLESLDCGWSTGQESYNNNKVYGVKGPPNFDSLDRNSPSEVRSPPYLSALQLGVLPFFFFSGFSVPDALKVNSVRGRRATMQQGDHTPLDGGQRRHLLRPRIWLL